MTTLSDTQAVLLSTAAQRDNGSVLPLSPKITPSGGLSKALAALVNRSLAEERETSDPAATHRTDGDLSYGLFITPSGAAAIGVELPGPPSDEGTPESGMAPAALPAVDPAPVRVTKAAAVLALLARPEGATLAELIEATGWLPHTTRAALTGLRKKGHAIERCKRDGATCYHLPAVA